VSRLYNTNLKNKASLQRATTERVIR